MWSRHESWRFCPRRWGEWRVWLMLTQHLCKNGTKALPHQSLHEVFFTPNSIITDERKFNIIPISSSSISIIPICLYLYTYIPIYNYIMIDYIYTYLTWWAWLIQIWCMLVASQGGGWKVSSGLLSSDTQWNAKNAFRPSWVSEKLRKGSM